MRAHILMSLAWFSTVVVARPYPTRTLLSSTPATNSSSISPSTAREASFLGRCALGMSISDGKAPGNDIYDELEPRSTCRPWKETSYPIKRQQYSALYGPNGQSDGGPAMEQATVSPTSPPGGRTKGVSGPTSKPSHSLVPNWSYKKHSIAAAIILIIVLAGAVVILLVLCFKKTKRYIQRRKKERDDSPPEYSAYDSPGVLNADAMSSSTKLHLNGKDMGQNLNQGTFSFNCGLPRSSSPGFVVETDLAAGSVTRVYRAKNDFPKSSDVPPYRSNLPHGGFLEEGGTTNYVPDSPSPIRKSCDAQKPVVIVPSPLTHALSICATRETQSSPGALTHHDGDSGMESSDENKRIRYSDPGPDPQRASYLPMIHPSSSPLFIFDGLQTEE